MVLEALLFTAAYVLITIYGTTPLTFGICLAVLCMSWPIIRLMRQSAPPFVPTSMRTVRTMLDLAHVKPGERVYDLGCGDGRLVIAAARQGAIATGYELSVPTFALACLRSLGTKNAHIRYGDFWKHDYRDADVIFCYLLKNLMIDFEQKIWPRLKPGARVVSHSFSMPNIPITEKKGHAYLYVK